MSGPDKIPTSLRDRLKRGKRRLRRSRRRADDAALRRKLQVAIPGLGLIALMVGLALVMRDPLSAPCCELEPVLLAKVSGAPASDRLVIVGTPETEDSVLFARGWTVDSASLAAERQRGQRARRLRKGYRQRSWSASLESGHWTLTRPAKRRAFVVSGASGRYHISGSAPPESTGGFAVSVDGIHRTAELIVTGPVTVVGTSIGEVNGLPACSGKVYAGSPQQILGRFAQRRLVWRTTTLIGVLLALALIAALYHHQVGFEFRRAAHDPEDTSAEVAEPQTLNPEVAEPQTLNPEVAEPQTLNPEVAEPQTLNPVVIRLRDPSQEGER